MNASVVVTYTIKPEALAEHLGLIADVFAELQATNLATADYRVLRLADGVSFVHVSTSFTADGTNPVPELGSFKAFSRDLASRVVGPPSASPADLIESHTP